MSYEATNWAYGLPLRGPAKPVLVALADKADEDNSCFPGQSRIASMTGLSVKTVARALTRLEELGLITRTRRNDARGHRTSDRYALNLDASLPDTEPSGQTAYKAHSPSLTDSLSIPNGLSDGVTIREPSDEPSDVVQPKGNPYPLDFEQWWAHYPRRQSKGDALNAWKTVKKARVLPDLDVLIRATDAYAKRETRPQFQKLPGGWLRAHKWVDESPGGADARATAMRDFGVPDNSDPAWKRAWTDADFEDGEVAQ